MARKARKRLGEILVEWGVVTPAGIEEALEHALEEGLRIGEALALHVKDVDLKEGTIQVLHGKGDRHRVVGIDAGARALLQLWTDTRRALGLSAAR